MSTQTAKKTAASAKDKTQPAAKTERVRTFHIAYDDSKPDGDWAPFGSRTEALEFAVNRRWAVLSLFPGETFKENLAKVAGDQPTSTE